MINTISNTTNYNTQSAIYSKKVRGSRFDKFFTKELDNEKKDTTNQENSNISSLNSLEKREYSLLKSRGLSDIEINDFHNIVSDAKNHNNANEFLSNLSIEDRDLVKKANSYGRSLTDNEIGSMTEEGARNMLVNQDYRAYVDFNNDGVVDKGIGKSFSFPPPNAPEDVKNAWDKTLESLPAEDRLMASSIFMVQSLQANFQTDSQGKVVGITSPGDEGYVNIFPSTLDGWQNLLDKTESYLEWLSTVDSGNPRLEKNFALIDSFRKNFA